MGVKNGNGNENGKGMELRIENFNGILNIFNSYDNINENMIWISNENGNIKNGNEMRLWINTGIGMRIKILVGLRMEVEIEMWN